MNEVQSTLTFNLFDNVLIFVKRHEHLLTCLFLCILMGMTLGSAYLLVTGMPELSSLVYFSAITFDILVLASYAVCYVGSSGQPLREYLKRI